MAKAMLSFEEWMAECNRTCSRMTGLDTADLPDYAWRDEYDDGARPSAAVARAVRNASE